MEIITVKKGKKAYTCTIPVLKAKTLTGRG